MYKKVSLLVTNKDRRDIMDNKRLGVKGSIGCTLDGLLNQLKSIADNRGIQTYTIFNGNEITSDMSIDEAYLLVTGRTKEENDSTIKIYTDRIKQKQEEHDTGIPKLEECYIKKARGIITDNKLAFLDKIVPIRLSDLYHGMELNCTLKLVEMLDINNCTLAEAENEFDNQGHSVCQLD